ncbi:MAG: phosphatase PAP2 family protein [Lachnospiraceae bacterium]|nr:phosphatase PAP2 family protein [Lachnospiraceae bacterium]
MKKGNTYISSRTVIGIYIFLFVMFILGTFDDYQISCALYNESNPVAVFFAAFGECPAYLGLVAAGTMALTACHRQHTLMGILQCSNSRVRSSDSNGCSSGSNEYSPGSHVRSSDSSGCSSGSNECSSKSAVYPLINFLQCSGGIILLIVGGVLTCGSPGSYLDWPTAASIGVGLLLTAMTVAVTLSLCRGADPAAVRRVALVFSLSILGQLLLVNVLKMLWGRARMRLVVSDPRAYFMPWWQPDTALRSILTAAGVAADEFKSFPSGHTADGTMAMLLAALPCIRPELEPHRKRLFWFGFIIACVTGFTRIIMGAHYLTDVTAGFLCGFTIMMLAFRLLPETKSGSA